MSTLSNSTPTYIPEDYFFVSATANARLVLMFLSTFKDGFFSTIQNLCLMTNLSRKTVDRALKDLFAKGLIYLDNSERDNVIRILPDAIKRNAASNRAKEQPHLLPKNKKAKTGSTKKFLSAASSKNMDKMSNSENSEIGQNVQSDWSKCPITKRDTNIYTNINVYKDLSTNKTIGDEKNFECDFGSDHIHISEKEKSEKQVARSQSKNQNPRSVTVRQFVQGYEVLVTYDENGEVDDAHFIDGDVLDRRPSEDKIQKNMQEANHTDALEQTLRHIITTTFMLSKDEAEQLLVRMRKYYAKSGKWRFKRGKSKNVVISEKMLMSIVSTWIRNDNRQKQKAYAADAGYSSRTTAYGSNNTSNTQNNVFFIRGTNNTPGKPVGYKKTSSPDALSHITDAQLRDSAYMAHLINTYGQEAVTQAIFGGMN
ncbi:MAG: hypothetical protein SPK70_02395 [Succinivibrio dextrinosolvens]|nr:hypothetical protein [Succinivibrio dextrinosolvens]MDY6420978.1 hypothetical protein [Succinivibrio dextrinosolvens]MDY6465006.1 hypothetical protein [Succinivibrio dextrinosolvens]MDY6469902.1 hypothetical protein [Succinivibrio dextrinosolvens]